MNTFISFLDHLAQAWDFERLAPDTHGHCALFFKQQQLTLLFEEDHSLLPDNVLCSCVLGKFSPHSAFYRQLLLHNQSCMSSLSYHRESEELILYHHFLYESDANTLQEALTNLLQEAEELKARLASE